MRIRMKLRQFSYNISQIELYPRYTHLGFAKPKEKKIVFGFVDVGSKQFTCVIDNRKWIILRLHKCYHFGIEAPYFLVVLKLQQNGDSTGELSNQSMENTVASLVMLYTCWLDLFSVLYLGRVNLFYWPILPIFTKEKAIFHIPILTYIAF